MKKYLPYILILIILIGLFSPIVQVYAQQAQSTTLTPYQQLQAQQGIGPAQPMDTTPSAPLDTTIPTTPLGTASFNGTTWTTTPPPTTPATAPTTTTTTTQSSAFQDIILGPYSCSSSSSVGWIKGCFTQVFYFLFMVIPAWILYIAAYFFNVFIAITLTSKLFAGSTFIPMAWTVVRDLSNIFFILILLYIAIRLILGIDAHGTKKTIAKVVIIALLINFSMFFTEVVIDSSNILALIFYNKINVGTMGPDGKTPKLAPYTTATGEKDVAGGLTGAFNPANSLNAEFFSSAAAINTVPGQPSSSSSTNPANIPFGVILGIMLLSGTVMLFASYAFFVSGLSFVGRMIELFVLIIFSPFALMSFTVPLLEKIDYIGWDAWFKRLLAISFMAPIFMFFMYFIFLLVGENIFNGLLQTPSDGPKSFILNVLGIILPATLILILLLKATDYAKKGSGKFGEMVMKGAQMVGGFAMGAVTGGASMLGTGLIGGGATRLAENEKLKEKAKQQGIGGFLARKTLQTANYGSKASFDLRKAPGMGTVAKTTGMNFQSVSALGLGSKEGGNRATIEKKAKSLKEESELYKTTMTDDQVKKWSDKRQEEYDARDAGYKTEHPRPEAYTKAEQLNNDRMKSFQNNLGLSGLLGTAAFAAINTGTNGQGIVKYKNFEKSTEYTKQYHETHGADKTPEWDESVAAKVNNPKIRKAKMAIGAAAALATGGVAGAAGAMVTGGLGSAAIGAGVFTGSALGAGYAGGYAMSEKSAENKVSKDMEKGFKDMEKVADRLAATTKALDVLTGLLEESGKTGDEKPSWLKDLKDENDNLIEGIVEGNKEKGFTVDQEKIEKALANLAFIAKREDLKLKKLIEIDQGDSKAAKEIQHTLVNNTLQTAKLSRLKTAEKDRDGLLQQAYGLGKDKKAMGAGDTSKTPSAPPAPIGGGDSGGHH